MARKWITFRVTEQKKGATTFVYNVIATHSGETLLGEIRWFGIFRKYSFFPSYDTVYEVDCLKEIIDFITYLTVDHLAHKLKEKCLAEKLDAYKLRMTMVDQLVSQRNYSTALQLLKQPL